MDNTGKEESFMSGIFKPMSRSVFPVAIQLALLDLVTMLFASASVYSLIAAEDIIKRIDTVNAIPLWAFLLPFALFYFITWYRFGKAYGLLLNANRFLNGFLIGLIGQIPRIASMIMMIHWFRQDMLMPELARIGLAGIVTLNVILPFIVGISSTDQKINRVQ